LYKGKVDAVISTNTNIATKLQSAEFKDFAAGPFVPNYDDVVGLIAKRSEGAWIGYLNLFLVHQIRDGNMNTHYNTYFGSDAPADLIQSLRDNK
jgi:ABC-type amino acid transport substrate-binding protein